MNKPKKQDFKFDYVFTITIGNAQANNTRALIIGEQLTIEEARKEFFDYRDTVARTGRIHYTTLENETRGMKRIAIDEMVDLCRFHHCYVFPHPPR
jgi:hypothetical protein